MHRPSAINLYTAETNRPKNTVEALAPPSSPAINTSAHALPSGYGSVPCSCTINAVRSGIINRMPITPPTNAIRAISIREGVEVPPSSAHINNAGSVKIAPAASDSPAEPIVCTILFSRIESRLNIIRMTPMEITAAGIDADTVIPTRSPRYAFAPPNKTASSIPRTIETGVISGSTFSAGIYGLNSFVSFIHEILLNFHSILLSNETWRLSIKIENCPFHYINNLR